MKRPLFALLPLLACVITASCVSTGLAPSRKAGSCLVYGKIMTQKGDIGTLADVILFRQNPGAILGRDVIQQIHTLDDGTFYAENLKPGLYHVEQILFKNPAISMNNANVRIIIDRKTIAFELTPDEIRYIGTWKTCRLGIGSGLPKFGSAERLPDDGEEKRRSVAGKVYEQAGNSEWATPLAKEIQ